MSLFLMYKKNTAQKTCVTVISKLTDFFHINTRLVDLEGGEKKKEKKTLAPLHALVIGGITI